MDTFKTFLSGALGGLSFSLYYAYTTKKAIKQHNEKQKVERDKQEKDIQELRDIVSKLSFNCPDIVQDIAGNILTFGS